MAADAIARGFCSILSVEHILGIRRLVSISSCLVMFVLKSRSVNPLQLQSEKKLSLGGGAATVLAHFRCFNPEPAAVESGN